ncbi:hypothetical protein Ancab_039287 [Ancistrocladus abbreviatus]
MMMHAPLKEESPMGVQHEEDGRYRGVLTLMTDRRRRQDKANCPNRRSQEGINFFSKCSGSFRQLHRQESGKHRPQDVEEFDPWMLIQRKNRKQDKNSEGKDPPVASKENSWIPLRLNRERGSRFAILEQGLDKGVDTTPPQKDTHASPS